MNAHLEISEVDPGSYRVRAVQGQVVTLHTIGIEPELCDLLGGLGAIPGTALARAVVELLLEHEPLAAIPAETRLGQLIAHYPYLGPELQERLSTGSVEFPLIDPPVIRPVAAEDHPTHT